MPTVKELRDAYRSFKSAHPVRNAKLPLKIRQMAVSLVRNGETPETLSKQLGLSKDCIRHWLIPPPKKKQTKKAAKGSKTREAKSKATIKIEKPEGKNSLIKVKINGFDLVSSRDDLRTLLGIQKPLAPVNSQKIQFEN